MTLINTLTYDKYQQHKEVIEWLYSKPNQQVWSKVNGQNEWKLTSIPSWSLRIVYAINDNYADERKHLVDGGTLQYRHDYSEEWKDTTKWINTSVYQIRIKPLKPNYTIGDWVVCGLANGKEDIWQIKEESDLESIQVYLDDGSYTSVTKWAPTEDELVWFWNNPNEYLVTRYSKSQQLFYKHVAPFTEQLPI